MVVLAQPVYFGVLSGRTTSWMCYPFILQSNMHLDFMLTVFRKWSDKFSLIFIGSVAVFLIDSSILISYGMFLILFLASLFQHIAAGVAFNFGFGSRVAPADIFNSAGVCDYSSASLSESMVFPFR